MDDRGFKGKGQCCNALGFGSSLQQAVIGLSASTGNCEGEKKRRERRREACWHGNIQDRRADSTGRTTGKKLLNSLHVIFRGRLS